MGIAALAGIGFGHVEIGTHHRSGTAGQPRSRASSASWEDKAVINRMGFNNDGAAAAGPRVAAAPQTSKPNTAAPYAPLSA